MSTFRLQITTDNDAFSGDPGPELARILRRVAKDVDEQGDTQGVCMDMNGNRVGSFRLTGAKWRRACDRGHAMLGDSDKCHVCGSYRATPKAGG
jgi:hypothetical protein